MLVVVLMIFPAFLSAQLISGIVKTGEPPLAVDSAQVILINLGNAREHPAVFSNDLGEYGVSVSRSGRYALWVRKIGYRPHLVVLTIEPTDTLIVDVVLDEFLVLVDGVTVYGIAAETEGQREFWSRRDLPWNASADYTQIERMHLGVVSEVVRHLPLTIHGCYPLVFVDGFKRRFLDDVPLDWVYGVEVYRGYFNIPIQYRDPFDERAQCGAVLLWTKSPS